MSTAITATAASASTTVINTTQSPPPLKRQRTATRHIQRVSTACEFLHSAFSTQRIHMDLDIPVTDFLRQFNLQIRRAPGNGHCLLHSWAMSTNTSIQLVKQQLLTEFTTHQSRYAKAAINIDQINRYLQSHTYTLDAVDAVIDILANATNTTVFVIGQKYNYTDPQHITPVINTMEIRRISPPTSINISQILLLKTREHYDSLI